MTLTEQAIKIIDELDEISSTYMRLTHSRDERIRKLADILGDRENELQAKIKKYESEIKAMKKQNNLF